MAKDKGIEGQPVKALAQESLAGVERIVTRSPIAAADSVTSVLSRSILV